MILSNMFLYLRVILKKQTMKTKRIIYFLALLLLPFLSNCSSTSEELTNDQEKDTQVAMASYRKLVKDHLSIIEEFYISNKLNSRSINDRYEDLKLAFLPSAQELAVKLDLKDSDLREISGTDIRNSEERNQVLIGVLLFSTVLEKGISDRVYDSRSKFTDCLQEVGGINATIVTFSALAKGTMSKAALKAAVQLAAKIGGRTLSGIGLAIMAAEMAVCMYMD